MATVVQRSASADRSASAAGAATNGGKSATDQWAGRPKPRIVDAIRKKREGVELSDDEIGWFVYAATNKLITDAQIGAMLMAVCLRGMTDAETTKLTDAMIDSGGRLRYPAAWKGLVAGKHSTGGVGDKVSIVLVPALAACGLKVPKISGRGLGYTGGTLDKLESIPGYSGQQTLDGIVRIVDRVGCCIVGVTEDLAPADKLLYAVRDTTGTTESIPLIAASVMSKKVAESLDALCLEVTYGKAALVKTREDGEKLARLMMETGRRLGIRTTSMLVPMDNVLGRTVGNSLEIMEAVECLNGKGPDDVVEVVCTAGGYLLWHCKKADSPAAGSRAIRKTLEDGSAARTFQKMLEEQGVTSATAGKLIDVDQMTSVLPQSSHVARLCCRQTGYVTSVDAYVCGLATHRLGSGRLAPGAPIDHSAGLRLLVAVGSKVAKGDVWVEVHHNASGDNESILAQLEDAITIVSSDQPPQPRAKHTMDIIE